ncbi:hypothetical protein KM043_005877 [Ampulex compressa]|nr:hypothetical protein KM043_005877 [Ampulex compressa]
MLQFSAKRKPGGGGPMRNERRARTQIHAVGALIFRALFLMGRITAPSGLRRNDPSPFSRFGRAASPAEAALVSWEKSRETRILPEGAAAKNPAPVVRCRTIF